MNYKTIIQDLKNDELFVIRVATFLAFFLPFIMAPKIWFSDRLFPLIPFFDKMPVPDLIGDIVLTAIFFSTFLMFLYIPKWNFGLPVVIIYIYWALIDQNRIQPFYFEIVFIVFSLIMFSNDPKRAKQCILLIFVGTYFWSGIHKWNSQFFEIWSNGLSKRIPFVPEVFRKLFTHSVPFLEASFGTLLIFSKTRKWGIWLITVMHIMILITFILGNFGYLVFPLTLFNIFALFYLFYRKPFSFKLLFRLIHPKSLIVFILSIVFPILNFFGYYDHLLSFSYFSAKPKYCRLHFNVGQDLSRLPINIKQNIRQHEGQYYIDFNEWSAKSINVMVYPEIRVYEKLQDHINKYLDGPNSYLELY